MSSGQALDLRTTFATLVRRRRTLMIAAVVGVVLGLALVLVHPPQYSSVSQVLLPQPPAVNGQPTSRDAATDVQVARSEVVLGRAGRAVSPRLSTRQVAKRVEVTSPASNVMQFRAAGADAADARSLAGAAASSEMEYIRSAATSVANAQQAALTGRLRTLRSSLAKVGDEITQTTARRDQEDATSSQGQADATALAQLTAQQADLVLQIDQVQQTQSSSNATGQPSTATLIQQASDARRPGLVTRYLLFGVGGGALATLLTALTLAAFGRRDRRLRFRDEIADALGTPVTAAIRAHTPRSVAGWTSLLQTYEPETVDAWALRQALRSLVYDEDGAPARHGGRGGPRHAHSSVITVVSLSDDAAALAVGPQLAAYAASSGIRTRLVAAQRHESAAPLWAACHRGPAQEEVRPGLFIGTDLDGRHDVDLTVVLAVVDRARPLLSGMPGSATTVIAVSSGSVTAEHLAHTAVIADDAGATISGLLVANPDELDRTTGRLLQRERLQEVALPSRLSGIPSGRPSRSRTTATGSAGRERRRRV